MIYGGGYFMLYERAKKEALAIHKKAVDKYNATLQKTNESGEQLYKRRKDSILLIGEIELLVNSIANQPKKFDSKISDIQIEQKKFQETEKYAEEAFEAAFASGIGAAAGVAAGAAVASAAPTAAMWVATTFGTASTGTAISALSGAAATKAALAWLGGGALSAGGAGIAGGEALLALAGPIGWGISGVAIAISAAAFGNENKETAKAVISEAKKITITGAELNETSAKIQHLTHETEMLMNALQDMASALQYLKNANYLELSETEQYQLGIMVNNTLSLSQLLNKTVSSDESTSPDEPVSSDEPT